jgi:DNA-binding PadR family transcriptional regulator
MSEARLLNLVAAYPHRTALARHARDGRALGAVGRLEARGLVRRQRDLYRLTDRGVRELRLTYAVVRLVLQSGQR